MMENEERETYIHFTPMRFCRTDETGYIGDPGKYAVRLMITKKLTPFKDTFLIIIIQ